MLYSSCDLQSRSRFRNRTGDLYTLVRPLGLSVITLARHRINVSVARPYVFACHHMSFRSNCRIPTVHWCCIRFVTNADFGLCVLDSAHNDTVLSDLVYFIRTLCLMLQLIVAENCHAIGGGRVGCRMQFGNKDPMFNDKLRCG